MGHDFEDGVPERVSSAGMGFAFLSNLEHKTPMVKLNKWTAKKKNKTPSFVFHPSHKKKSALNSRNLVFIMVLGLRFPVLDSKTDASL
jgi:hypothetical protein